MTAYTEKEGILRQTKKWKLNSDEREVTESICFTDFEECFNCKDVEGFMC